MTNPETALILQHMLAGKVELQAEMAQIRADIAQTRAELAALSEALPRPTFNLPGPWYNNGVWGATQVAALAEPYEHRATAQAIDKIVVFLHTWNGDYTQCRVNYPAFLPEKALIISPNFFGPNGGPKTICHQDGLARIMAVIDDCKARAGLSAVPVHLVGASGGGMAALKFLASYPGVISKASIWVPIFNLAEWYAQTDSATRNQMISALGRAPTAVDATDTVYWKRSPEGNIFRIGGKITIHINTSTNDTTVPTSHHTRTRDELLAIGGQVTVCAHNWTIGHNIDLAQAMQQIA